MSANPDTIEIAAMPPGDVQILVGQLLQAGYEGAIGVLGGAGLKVIAAGAGGVENLRNVYWLELIPVDHPGIAKLNAEFESTVGGRAPENQLFPVFTLATEVALQGILKAQTDQDGEKVAAELRRLTPESRYLGKAGWRGKTLYGVNQELTFPIGLGLIVDGKKLPVKTVDIPAE